MEATGKRQSNPGHGEGKGMKKGKGKLKQNGIGV